MMRRTGKTLCKTTTTKSRAKKAVFGATQSVFTFNRYRFGCIHREKHSYGALYDTQENISHAANYKCMNMCWMRV